MVLSPRFIDHDDGEGTVGHTNIIFNNAICKSKAQTNNGGALIGHASHIIKSEIAKFQCNLKHNPTLRSDVQVKSNIKWPPKE